MCAMRTTDPLRGPCRGDIEAGIAWVAKQGGQGPFADYGRELYARCAEPEIGLDASELFAEGSEETDKFRSLYWLNDGNVVGIGIDYGGKPSAFSIPNNGRLAAHLHIAIMLAHLGRTSLPDSIKDALDVPGFRPLWVGSVNFATSDSGFKIALPSGVRTLKDLCVPFRSSITGNTECVHACDDQYAVNICEHGNAMWPALPDAQGGTPVPTPNPAPNPAPGIPLGQNPYVLVTAGHNNQTEGGGPGEEAHTLPLARAYVAALKQAGYQADCYQDLYPDFMQRNLDVVGQDCAKLLAKHPAGLLIDVHFADDGGPVGIGAIYPNSRGLTPAAGSAAPNPVVDGPGDNPLDSQLCAYVAQEVSKTTGLAVRTASVESPGVIPEYNSGVGLNGWRLAMFEWTASVQSTAVRIIIEHGDARYQPGIVFADGFNAKAVAGLLSALKRMGWVAGAQPQPQPQPQPRPQPGPTPPPADHAAAFGSAVCNGKTYKYDPAGTITKLWLQKGQETGAYPKLLAVAESKATATAKDASRFFMFANGSVAMTSKDGAPAAWLVQAA